MVVIWRIYFANNVFVRRLDPLGGQVCALHMSSIKLTGIEVKAFSVISQFEQHWNVTLEQRKFCL